LKARKVLIAGQSLVNTQAVFKGIKETHHLQPLAIYNENDKFVSPKDVPSTLKGSLVEVTLKLKHYHIKSTDKPAFDSFMGGIEQIVILKHGAPPTPSPFRTQLKKGPVHPSQTELQEAANAFNPVPQAFNPVSNITGSTSEPVSRQTTLSEGEAQLGDKRQPDNDGEQGTKKPKKGKGKVSINTK
jgi:hypothetical protein